MIFKLVILPLLKLISSLISVLATAGVKTSKDTKRYETNLKHVEKEIAKGGRARQHYGNDAIAWMDLNDPKTVSFKDEFFSNAHRPLVVLYFIMLWAQLTYPIAFMAVLLGFSFYFIEQHIEKIRNQNWYRLVIISIWVISIPTLIYSELIVNSIDFWNLLTE
jgi:hypothetical protein